MKLDYFVLTFIWITIPIILFKVIPRDRLREAIATFLFFQMLTWLASMALTYAGLLHSPIRIFTYATQVSFTMEFLVLPAVAVLFQLYFPKNAMFLRRLLHYLLWIAVMLLIMFFLGRFTNILEVTNEHYIRSFFNFLIELWLCRRFVLWIMEEQKLKRN